MHNSTYGYLIPTDDQFTKMERLKQAAKDYHEILQNELPEGPDKTFIIRNHRTTAMWVNVAVTRLPDGSPRE